mmetsp:Transcript_11862/g.16574  ORF Transcript_11862/g.16574 Transcript_11862/m.16574 type:complete len:349 (-) Transcript_11862:167-1213(-)
MTNFMVADIKGWIPRYALELALGDALYKFYAETIPEWLQEPRNCDRKVATDYVGRLFEADRPKEKEERQQENGPAITQPEEKRKEPDNAKPSSLPDKSPSTEHASSENLNNLSLPPGLSEKEMDWVRAAKKSMARVIREVERDQGEWYLKEDNGPVRVYCGNVPNINYKVFKAMGIIDASPTRLFNLTYDAKLNARWNTNNKVYKVVKTICARFDIIYVQSNRIGPISPRDQFKVRVWQRYKSGYACASCSVNIGPPNAGIVRAHTPPGDGFVVLPVDGQPGKSQMINFMVTDIKGWIPRSVVDVTVGGALLKFYEETLPAALRNLGSEVTDQSAKEYVQRLSQEETK